MSYRIEMEPDEFSSITKEALINNEWHYYDFIFSFEDYMSEHEILSEYSKMRLKFIGVSSKVRTNGQTPGDMKGYCFVSLEK